MAEKKKVNVQIDGRDFVVVGSNSEAYVKELAAFVDCKIKDLTSKNDRLSQTMAATLAALNITDELVTTKDKLEELESKAKEPIEKYELVLADCEKSQEKIKELELKCMEHKDDLLKSKLDNENMNKEIKKYVHALEIKEKELVESQKTIKSLQDKIYENQIKLIEKKKELNETNNLKTDKKESIIKEEV